MTAIPQLAYQVPSIPGFVFYFPFLRLIFHLLARGPANMTALHGYIFKVFVCGHFH